MATIDWEYVSGFELSDCGDPLALRYQIHAVQAHPEDTGRAAFAFVAGFEHRDVAEWVLVALHLRLDAIRYGRNV